MWFYARNLNDRTKVKLIVEKAYEFDTTGNVIYRN